MSKNRIDLIPIKVYLRDGSKRDLKIGALANCRDTLRELVMAIRSTTKLKTTDPLLRYFTICSVTGQHGIGMYFCFFIETILFAFGLRLTLYLLERIIPHNEDIWKTVQNFETNDRLEFCRYIYPPQYTIPTKRTSTSSISNTSRKSGFTSSSSDPENNNSSNRAYVSDSEAMAKKRINIVLSDQEKEKESGSKRSRNSNSQTSQDMPNQRIDKISEWAEFLENIHLFIECPIHRVTLEELTKLTALYIYSIMKQKNYSPARAVEKYFNYAFPPRLSHLVDGRVKARALEYCMEFKSDDMSVDDTLHEFNTLFKSWKYYGFSLFHDCKFEDKKLNVNSKNSTIGINGDGIIILKKDGDEIIAAYPLSSISFFTYSGNVFSLEIVIDADKTTEHTYTCTIHSPQAESILYTLESYLDHYVSMIFCNSDSLKKLKGDRPMIKILSSAYSRKQNSNSSPKEDKKKKRKSKRRGRSSSVSSKSSDVDSGVKSSDDSVGSKR